MWKYLAFYKLMHPPMDDPSLPSIICSLESYALNPDPVCVALAFLDPWKYVILYECILFLEYECFSESCELLLIVFMSYIPHVALQYMSCALYYISGLT